jgi:hypothetical protein
MGYRVNSTRGTTGRLAEGWERDEMYGRVRRLLGEGCSDLEVARRTGLANRTIARYRDKEGIGNVYQRGVAA